MRATHISGVPVVDEKGALLGTVTELNLIARSAPIKQPHYLTVLSALIPLDINEYREYKAQLRQTLATNASELMSQALNIVEPTMPLEEALEIMLEPENSLLLVVEQGRLIGVVTRTDLVRLIEQLEAAPEETTGQA